MNQKTTDLELRTSSEEETFNLAERLARQLAGNELILISGELGAGKTVLVKGLASGLGVVEPEAVCSPSFTLVNIYRGQKDLIHVDLYRLENPEEIADLGLEDYLGTGVVAVEWAERLPADFRTERMIEIAVVVEADETRLIKIRTKNVCLRLDNK
ncbi:MAG: tRNA (adenosine(37)-N6)-threonylcarbamoyltransferase complex ATPase subunit type 1 TsaE [Candidatus Saccharicenans sp.]|jgi:tRNA threonylcarbamoyladenosine biosynthesis protein TsaE|nr:tRNA (adenosine(37)-N6)-threonylcarbamoyltransferase complex ATPase subunit type 1 TsaE [Candidatus Saccharicenans sp.]MDH7492971.1 tRNA (adenosine(37)-N6)-threonylcarbamoyltransferase complex ATPase subunit type 1 TsaE [Candidatus Saccharicenans sp.]